MNILQVVPHFDFNSAEMIEFALAQRIRDEGGKAVIASRMPADAPMPRMITQEGHFYYQITDQDFFEVNWEEKIRTAGQNITEIIKIHDINLIHAHTGISALMGREGIRLSGRSIPICSTVHGWGLMKKDFERERDRDVLNSLDYSAAVSYAVRTQMIEAGVYPEKIGVIHNGLDINSMQHVNKGMDLYREFPIPEGVPVIGCVARLDPIKGHLALLEALQKVKEKYPNHYCLLIGDPLLDGPEYKAQLEQYAIELGLGGNLHFCGHRKDALSIIKKLDVLVIPSLYESFGMTALEALYFGVPVIASNIGGLPEIITHGEEGLLCPVGDTIALAMSIITLLEDKHLRMEMGTAGQKRVRHNFTLENMTNSYMELYKSLSVRESVGVGMKNKNQAGEE